MADYRAIACPTLALCGEEFAGVGQMFGMPKGWAEMADQLRAVPITRRGHLPHEERPDEVNALPLDFLAGWDG